MPDMQTAHSPMIRLHDLQVEFRVPGKRVQAVNGVNLEVGPGEVVALIGESGSGKSVTLKAMMRLHPPRRTRYGGGIRIGGRDILSLSERELGQVRGSVVSMIFQEPMLAFDPVYTIGRQIAETVVRHEGVSYRDAEKRALELLELVQIPSAARRLKAYPHEMSGGMRQRAMIALALSCRPDLLLADEPTTALDATVQMQVLVLLRQLQREMGMAVIFVTHDMGVAAEIADHVAVMYAGRFIEAGPVGDVIGRRLHPYTEGLLASTVHGASRGERLQTIPGAPPNLARLPAGCSFAPRCRYVEARCRETDVPLFRPAPDHTARCLRIDRERS